MPVFTGDGKCLIAWDMGCGPTWAYDPLGKPIKEKYLGACEVWRSAEGGVAVKIGETAAEVFLDDQVDNGAVVTYWIMEQMKTGGLRQVGPTIDVELPQARLYDDDTPPSPPNELRAKRKSGGNELSWLASCDDESGVLAYFVYSANEHQPDAVLWVVDPLERLPYGDPSLGETDDYAPLGEVPKTATSQARYKWLDRTTDGKKPYIMCALDGELNLSDPTGRVDPWTGLPPATPGKEREPVEPVVPEGSIWVEVRPAGDENRRWTAVGIGGEDADVVLAADDFGRLWLSKNGGGAWAETRPDGDVEKHWYTCCVSGNGLVMLAGAASGGVGTRNGRLYLSTNGGGSWAEVLPVPVQTCSITTSTVGSPAIITTATDHGFLSNQYVDIAGHTGSTPDINGRRLVTVTGARSFSIPITVTVAGTGGTATLAADMGWLSCAANEDGSVLMAGQDYGRLWVSTNGGATWTETEPNIYDQVRWYTCCVSGDGLSMMAGTYGRLYLSTNGGGTWAEVRPAGDVDRNWLCTALSDDKLTLLAGVFSGANGRLYLSTNGGGSWVEVQPAGNEVRLWGCCAVSDDGEVLLAGVYSSSVNGRLYSSFDGGATWAEEEPDPGVLKDWRACAVNADGSILIAGEDDGRLYRYGDWPANLIANPSAADNIDGWTRFTNPPIERVTSISGLPFPAGVSTALCIEADSGFCYDIVALPGDVAEGDSLMVSAYLSAGATATAGTWTMGLYFCHGQATDIGEIYCMEGVEIVDGWTLYSGTVEVPVGADGFIFYATSYDLYDGSLYATLVDVESA